MQLLEPLKGKLPRMQKVWADSGYGGMLPGWVQANLGWQVEPIQHLPRRRLMRNRGLPLRVPLGRATKRLSGVAQTLGGGAHLRLVG